jgi:hypothetical protein
MSYNTPQEAQNRWNAEKQSQMQEYESAKAAATVRRSIDGKVGALALALHELYRAKPDAFAGHGDPFVSAQRIIDAGLLD